MSSRDRGRWRPRSLRTRLLLWLITLHVIAAVATAWFSFGAYGRMVHTFMDDQMRLVAESRAGNRKPGPLQALDAADVQVHGAVVVQEWSADGAVPLASGYPVAAVPLQQTPGFADVRSGPGEGQSWRVFTVPEDAEQPDRPRVQVLQSEAFRQKRIAKRALYEGLPLALMLPATLLMLWLIVSATSRALRGVAREVAAQDERSVAELPLARVPDEIGPLVAAFNTLLARLRNAFVAQRRFVQDAAHELRTPMAAIGLQLENLRGHVPRGEASERFSQLEAGVTRAQHLIEQLLQLSRQEGAINDARAPVDVAALLRESLGQRMMLADQRSVDVGFDGRIAPVLDASRTDLHSVFDNLVDNALRHTPEGGVVDVRLHAIDGRAVVDVVDDGPGIAPQWRDQVFDRFFRVPGTPPGGSGLGLAIAQAAAARQGLRIELRDRMEDGEGTNGLIARVHLLTPA
ncbi:sensor histidine kinase [Variovorax rhizosphaerae]|uniref:histidine kinase n=1 Tax=Variovorax rhizosphaerae TaxID=1836200 RepID=A0ABU8WJX9_9BURK